jgi:hypothetical protein
VCTHCDCRRLANLAMLFKPVESARDRERAITGAHLATPVRAGARFNNGVLAERDAAGAACLRQALTCDPARPV